MSSRHSTFKSQHSQRRIEAVRKALAEPKTVDELAEAIQCSRRVATRFVKHMRETPGQLYIAGWRKKPFGDPAARYRVGDFPDAKRPKSMSKRELERRWLKNNPEAAIKKVLAQRLRRMKVRRDPLVASFFGQHGTAT